VAGPRQIGQFHIKRIIASGGMGTVYEAVQEQPRRTVAVKVLKQGVASPASMRRFEYESQVLARLRHPGIAQVYDAGIHTDPSGMAEAVPFFAMEYIPNAKPITRFADDKKLSTRERLELFAHVCDAVHHGHQKGIIHRDLKPGNLLVDSSGDVKIIDFGVARGTDSDLTITTLQTDMGQLIGTLQYMSPEQCDADPHDIDTRSDVYALGVVLYQLVSGTLPYDVSTVPALAPHIIREEQPKRLSAVDPNLPRDIETIVAKTLEKERERRYQSAHDLAEDIRRYLSGVPIVARPPSFIYQFHLLARRNKALFGAVATLFLVLVSGVVVTSVLAVRATRAQASAIFEAESAKAINEFLNNDLLAAVAPGESGPDVTVREVLDVASKNIEGKFADRPLIEATIRLTLASTYWRLGEYADAIPHAEQAVALRTAKLGEEHRDTLNAAHKLGMYSKYHGSLDDAERLYAQTLEARRRVLGNEDPDTLESISDLAVLRRVQRRFDEAAELHREALRVRRDVLGKEHPDTLTSMAALAVVLTDKFELDEAEVLASEALEIRLQVLGEQHPRTIHSMYTLARIFKGQEKQAEAEELYERTLRVAREVYGDGHPLVATLMYGLGLLLRDKGDLESALPLLRAVVQMRSDRLGEHSWKTANARADLGACILRLGHYEEAEKELLAAHQTFVSALGANGSCTLRTVKLLVELYDAWGRAQDAANWRERLPPEGSAEAEAQKTP